MRDGYLVCDRKTMPDVLHVPLIRALSEVSAHLRQEHADETVPRHLVPAPGGELCRCRKVVEGDGRGERPDNGFGMRAAKQSGSWIERKCHPFQ